jgi:hypothetical protein
MDKFITGFVKLARDYGIDPLELLKVADTMTLMCNSPAFVDGMEHVLAKAGQVGPTSPSVPGTPGATPFNLRTKSQWMRDWNTNAGLDIRPAHGGSGGAYRGGERLNPATVKNMVSQRGDAWGAETKRRTGLADYMKTQGTPAYKLPSQLQSEMTKKHLDALRTLNRNPAHEPLVGGVAPEPAHAPPPAAPHAPPPAAPHAQRTQGASLAARRAQRSGYGYPR